jgi:hypothetical protein
MNRSAKLVAAGIAPVAVAETPEDRVERLLFELADAMSALHGRPHRTYRDAVNGVAMVMESRAHLSFHSRVDAHGDKRWPA